MTLYYATTLFVCAILAGYLATRVFFNKNYKKPTFLTFSLTAFSSAMWSLGYAGMLISKSEAEFLVHRAIGLIGLFAFLIVCQVLLCIIAGYKERAYRHIAAFAALGVIVLFFVLPASSVTVVSTENGYVTTFNSGLVSVLYTCYTLMVAINFVIMSIRMTSKRNKKRIIVFGRKLLAVEALILLGMVIDTVLPALGTNLNIPASTMLQFVGLEIVYYAVHKFNRNQLHLQNMTGYIYKSLKSPILVFDNNDCIAIANAEAKRMFDSDIDLEGYSGFWADFLKIEAPSGLEQLADTLVIDAEYKVPHKKGIQCRLNIDPIFDEFKDLLGYIVVISDMTLTVQYMHEMEESRNEAMRANQAKSAFLANMSHEIRTPMNSILGFSELALQDDVDDKARAYLTDIRDSAETLLVTINDILDVSKIESGKMELVNEDYKLAKVLRAVSLIIGVQATRKQLDFHMEVDPKIPNVLYGDPTKMRAVLINLLNNGIKYTKEGSVTLSISVVSKDDTIVRLRFAVVDTGMGIKKEDLEKIFDKFQRVDAKANSATEGTGIGLSLVQGFLGLMDGHIEVKSEYGKGSTFSFEIDQLIRDASPIQLDTGVVEKRIGEKPKYSNVRALVVDDNSVNLKVAQMALQRLGITTETALSGPKAIELCKEIDFDLILMDHMMPDMDGIEATQLIRALGRGYEVGGNRKIVMLTANVMGEVKNEYEEAGFDGFLGKPIEFEVMEKMFEELFS